MRLWQAACALLLIGAGEASDRPSDYAWHTPVTVAPDAQVQRLPLLAAALVRVQRADLADLRLFDADGKPLPVALLPERPRQMVARQIPVTPLPILGAPGSLTVTGIGLRVDPQGEARVVRIDGTPASPAGTAVLGILLDTWLAKGPATALTLDVDVPRQQPVTFRIEGSADLRQWDDVTEHVVYRSPGASTLETIALDSGTYRYLRISWRAATPLLAPVTIKAAALTITVAAKTPQITAQLTGAVLVDPHDLQFTLPFASDVAAVRITPASDTLVPVRILGRNDVEEPWTPIGEGTVRRLSLYGAVDIGPQIELSQRGFRQFRIEASKQSVGFSGVPRLDLVFPTRDLLFLQTGREPYTLAAGRAGAQPAFLPATALLSSASIIDLDALPLATVAAEPVMVASVDTDSSGLRRTWILWAALLAGVVVLGIFASLASRKPVQK